ncbi:MAG: type II toxin-antitoxin system HicA family toxin [Dehalococcoidia bacterium]|nr:type II toxin-antitoxin system HicA family toxin [Dehalococcoidia bacterium]
MTKLPILKPRKVVEVFIKLGFEKERQKGSHAIFHHPNCRRAPLSIHPSKTVDRYVLAHILKQLDVDEDEFLRALRRR